MKRSMPYKQHSILFIATLLSLMMPRTSLANSEGAESPPLHETNQSKEDTRRSKVSPYVLEKLETQDTMAVVLYLHVPNQPQATTLANEIGTAKVTLIYPDAVVARLTQEEIAHLAERDDVKYIVPFLVMKPALEDAVEIVDAVLAWELEVNGVNLDGQGQTVCVIDTGVDFSHPDLASKNIASGNFNCVSPPDPTCPLDPAATDVHGHGTHVVGIAAAQGGINGIAKGADIISMKVFADGDPSTNNVLIRWAIQQCVEKAGEYNIGVITMSLGADFFVDLPCDFVDQALTDAINAAADNNIPVSIATGNAGSAGAGISFPACISTAISVGATNKDDTVASYSNYHPDLMKIFAPGTGISSTCLGGGHCLNSGTSMATPMVAGAIAILQQYHALSNNPPTSPEEMESLLYVSGEPVIGLPDDYARINIYQAILHSCASSENGVIYVDANNPTNFLRTGSAWCFAFTDLQDALDVAQPGDEIRVAAGTYKPDRGTGDRAANFDLVNGVAMRGGYAGNDALDPDERDIGLHETILTGDLIGDDGPDFLNNDENSFHVVTATSVDCSAVIDGFTISGGSDDEDGGGGMRCRNGSPAVNSCVFRSNSGRLGGGMLNVNSSPTVTYCVFVENRADHGGGGMHNANSSPEVTGCTFAANFSDVVGGGGMDNAVNSSPTISRCIFRSNGTNLHGGGISVHGSNAVISNSMFWNNSAGGRGGAVASSSESAVQLSNSTIGWNLAGSLGTELFSESGSSLTLINGIVWGPNSSNLIVGPVTINYSAVRGGFEGIGNIDADPLFVDTDGQDKVLGTEDDDLHLLPDSPCINMGDPGFVPEPEEADLDGEPRIMGCRVDMGADEHFADCNDNGILDDEELTSGQSSDCNENCKPDECDLADGTSPDCDESGTPDECEEGIAPLITSQPESQEVEEGADFALFGVQAEGLVLAYQWRKDGMELTDGGDFLGTNQPTLFVLDVQPKDAGSYDCLVTELVTSCSTLSDAATLTVLKPACPADLDGDGQVRVPDLVVLLAAWGPNPGHPADLDDSGEVRVPDLILLLASWGPCVQNLVFNGEFTKNADGWELIPHSDANWQGSPGWDDNPGWFKINHLPGEVPETSQLITGLIPGESYTISGYFKRLHENWPDPNFRVLLDKEILFEVGGSVEDGWTNFSFEYVANNSEVLLRFQAQVTGDDEYGIDAISFVRK